MNQIHRFFITKDCYANPLLNIERDLIFANLRATNGLTHDNAIAQDKLLKTFDDYYSQ
jgi:hypothetical protein